jgi:hypothetical protein
MKRTFLIALLLCPLYKEVFAQTQLLSKSDMIKLDLQRLAETKRAVEAHDPACQRAYAQLRADADGFLGWGPVSVMDKDGVPPSGNKHDYMSIAPYFWPDPSKPGGVPYVNRDGEVNPEVKNYKDKENITRLCDAVYTLGLAYYFSGEEKYAHHATDLLRAWFLDTATRMNPNLNYGQAVKGVTTGRAPGLIETRNFAFLLDGVDLIETSKVWTSHDQVGLKDWFRSFLYWLQTSPIGLDELHAKNNHGVWYDAQCLSIALYLDSTQLADRIVLRAAGRLDTQMDPDGFFPLELKRTTSLHYSVFVLNAFYVIAQMSVQTSTNLWTWTSPSGKTLRKAFDVMLPYLDGDKPWTGPQIHPFEFKDAVPLLLRSAQRYGCTSCPGAIEKITGDKDHRLLSNLL